MRPDRKSIRCATDAARLFANKLPESIDVPAVVARTADGRFQDKRAARELRMVQDSTKTFKPDFPFANVLMTIEMRAKSALRVIDVNHEHSFQPDCLGNFC